MAVIFAVGAKLTWRDSTAQVGNTHRFRPPAVSDRLGIHHSLGRGRRPPGNLKKKQGQARRSVLNTRLLFEVLCSTRKTKDAL